MLLFVQCLLDVLTIHEISFTLNPMRIVCPTFELNILFPFIPYFHLCIKFPLKMLKQKMVHKWLPAASCSPDNGHKMSLEKRLHSAETRCLFLMFDFPSSAFVLSL